MIKKSNHETIQGMSQIIIYKNTLVTTEGDGRTLSDLGRSPLSAAQQIEYFALSNYQ